MSLWRKLSQLLLIYSLVLCVPIHATDYRKMYWLPIKIRADAIFDQFSAKIVLEAGLGTTDEIVLGDNIRTQQQGTFGALKTSLPLYSSDVSRKMLLQKDIFLKEASSLISLLEKNQKLLPVLENKAITVKAIMKKDGIAGVEKYYEVLERMSVIQVEMDDAKRKLEAMLE